jgi:hypothetical protein
MTLGRTAEDLELEDLGSRSLGWGSAKLRRGVDS